MGGLLTYTATFILGLLHALEPGHGKSILAAFSLRQTNFRVFAALLSSLFVSHFLVLGVFAFGLQTLASADAVKHYAQHLEWGTPLLVIAYGSYLWFKARKHRKTPTGCTCGHHHNHQHNHDKIANTRTASITGFIAGLMPCPTAIAPLIISGMHNGFSSSLLHILIYVVGMTLALLIFTGLLSAIKILFHKTIEQLESRINLNALSALVMIAVGVVYLAINISTPDAHHHF